MTLQMQARLNQYPEICIDFFRRIGNQDDAFLQQ